MNRRDLLKLFGAEAIIAPAVRNLASPTTAMARIIEPPKVELIQPEVIEARSAPKWSSRITRVRVTTEFENGHQWDFESQGWISEMKCQPIDVTSNGSIFTADRSIHRQYVSGAVDLTLKLNGCGNFVRVR